MTFLSILALGLILLVLHHLLSVFAAAVKVALVKAAVTDGVEKIRVASDREKVNAVNETLRRAQQRGLLNRN